ARAAQAIDEGPVDLRRRRDGDGLGVVLVEDQPHRDAARDGAVEGCEQRLRRRSVEAQVVDRDVKGVLRGVEKACDPLSDRHVGLLAVAEEEDVYCASALGSPVCSRGSSISTGRGRVAISAASSGSSVTVISSKSSSDIAPCESTTARIQSSRPFQYFDPNSTIGKCSIFPVCARVSDSNSSSSVPRPPGKMTKPRAYFTNMFLRTKK